LVLGRWGVLATLCLARMLMGLHLQVVAAVAPFLMTDLNLSYGEIGTLIGIFLLPGVVLAIPGGLVSRRFGDARTLTGAVVLLASGTALLAASTGFWSAAAARLVSGAGGTLLTMQVAKIATDWFAGRALSTAIGLLLGTFPLGIAAVMAGLPLAAAVSSWRVAVAVIVGVALVILVVVAALLRDAPTAAAPAPGRRWDLSGHEAALMVVSGLIFSVVNAGLVIFTSFAPAWLHAGGLDAVQAGLLASWTSWVMIAALPLAGPLLDRTGRVSLWLVGTALAAAVVCVALPLSGSGAALASGPAVVWIVLFGVLMGPLAVGSMALPGTVLRPESRSIGFGLFFTINYVGFGVLPAVAGFLIDATGTAAAPFWFDAVVFLSVVPLALLFHTLQRRAVAAG
jgi:MFS family permease